MSDPDADLTMVKQDIRSLLISAPNGLTPLMLERDYKETMGHEIPYRKFGYVNCLGFVHSIPEIVRVSMKRGEALLFGVADKSTEHILKMVQKQKKSKFYSRVRASPRRTIGSGSLPPVSTNLPQCNEYLSTASTISFKTANTTTTSVSHHTSTVSSRTSPVSNPSIVMSAYEQIKCTGSSGSTCEKFPDYASGTNSLPNELNSNKRNTSHWKTTSPWSSASKDNDSNFGITSSRVSNSSPTFAQLQSEILELLKEYTNGICSIEVPGRYEKKFHKEFDLHRHGYYSIVEFFVTMTDRVHMCRLSRSGDWLLKLRSNMNTFQDDDDSSSITSNVRKADILKIEKDIKELTSKYKGGIVIKSLEDIYEMHFGRCLPIKELGFQSVAELICMITDKLDILNNELCLRSSSVSFVTKSSESPIESAPVDAVGRGICYKPPAIPCAEWGFFDCFVSHVATPEDFMIQVISEETTTALDVIMDEIEIAYNHPNAKEYKMPPHMAKKGQICVAMYQGDDNWNRAIINSDPQSGFVDVLFVDYGDVASVSIDSLHLMKSTFLSLPALMIRCRLAHLKPPDLENWAPEAKRVMLDVSRNKPMVAEVVGSGECNKISIVLCDTSQQNVDVYLNDVLLEKGLAILVPEEATPAQLLTIRRAVEMKKEEEKRQTAVHTLPQEAPPPYEATNTTQDMTLVTDTGDRAAASTKQKRFLQPYLLEDNIVIHVINYEGNAMVASGEISSLFRPEADDLLVPMLLLKDLDFPELALENVNKHAKLFDEFKACQVKGTFLVEGLKSIVTLYRLADVPGIIDGLDHSNKRLLKRQFAEITLSFDPAAPHWFSDASISPVNLSKTKEAPFSKTTVGSSSEEIPASSTPIPHTQSSEATTCSQSNNDITSRIPSASTHIAEAKQHLLQRREEILDELVENKTRPPSPRLVEELKHIIQEINLDKPSGCSEDSPAMKDTTEEDREQIIRNIWSADTSTLPSKRSPSQLEQIFSRTSLPNPFPSSSHKVISVADQHQKSPATTLVATITPFIPAAQRRNIPSAPVQGTRTVTSTGAVGGVASAPPGLLPPQSPRLATPQMWYCLTTMSFLPHPCLCVRSQSCWLASQNLTAVSSQPPWACPTQQPVVRCAPPPPPGLGRSQPIPTTQGFFML